MTIAQIAYIASRHDTDIARATIAACVEAAARSGAVTETVGEYERLQSSAEYRAEVLGGGYA